MQEKFREITIAEAVETQDYSHEEMENLVFIEKPAFNELMGIAEEFLREIRCPNPKYCFKNPKYSCVATKAYLKFESFKQKSGVYTEMAKIALTKIDELEGAHEKPE